MKANEVVRKLTLARWMVACSFWPALGMAGDTATERSSSDPLGLITSDGLPRDAWLMREHVYCVPRRPR